MSDAHALGLVDDEGRTSRRFRAAVARAALRMLQRGDDGEDLRFPVAAAVIELCPGLGDDEIAQLVMQMTRLEAAELTPLLLRPRALP